MPDETLTVGQEPVTDQTPEAEPVVDEGGGEPAPVVEPEPEQEPETDWKTAFEKAQEQNQQLIGLLRQNQAPVPNQPETKEPELPQFFKDEEYEAALTDPKKMRSLLQQAAQEGEARAIQRLRAEMGETNAMGSLKSRILRDNDDFIPEDEQLIDNSIAFLRQRNPQLTANEIAEEVPKVVRAQLLWAKKHFSGRKFRGETEKKTGTPPMPPVPGAQRPTGAKQKLTDVQKFIQAMNEAQTGKKVS